MTCYFLKGCAPTFEKEISEVQIFFLLLGCFRRKFCHANLDSREQQAILLKKWKFSGVKIQIPKFKFKLRFFCLFFRQNFWHDFRFCHAVPDFCEHQGLPPD